MKGELRNQIVLKSRISTACALTFKSFRELPVNFVTYGDRLLPLSGQIQAKQLPWLLPTG